MPLPSIGILRAHPPLQNAARVSNACETRSSGTRPTWRVLTALVIALGSGVAHAGDITTVTVTEAGPDKTIPTDQAFYLAGTAKGASRVQVLILRTGHPQLYRSGFESCRSVDNKLKGLKAKLADLKPMRTTADVIWTGGESDWDVDVPPAWTPTAGSTSSDFKILIDHDDFFSAGHGYCFYIYQDTTTNEPDASIAKVLLDALTAAPKCNQTDVCTFDHAKIDAAVAAISDTKMHDTVMAAVNESTHFAQNMTSESRDAHDLLNTWAQQAVPPYALPGTATGALGDATIALLAYSNKLAPWYTPTFKGYMTNDGATLATSVSFLAGNRIRIIGPPTIPPRTPGPPRPPPIPEGKTTELMISDTGSSLEDLLQLAQGRLPLDKSYLTPTEYLQRLAPILREYSTPLGDDDAKLLASARTALHTLRVTIDHIHQAASSTDPQSKAAILWQLRQWLASVEAPCDKARATCQEGTGWDSYASLNPLDKLDEDLKNFASDQAKWIAARPNIVKSAVHTTPVTRTMQAGVEYTRDTWFFSYVSPVLGYAIGSPVRNGSRTPFTLLYYALQLNLVPNPDHQPTKGLLTFELGASPGTGAFGPDNRYRGWGNVSPVFVGAGLHLIPYTTITAGVMIAERRSSTVPQESYHVFGAGYIGLSVDANIPDLVRTAMGNSTKTTGTTTSK